MSVSGKYGVGYAFAIALLIGVAVAAYVGQTRYEESSEVAERANRVISDLEMLWTELIEAESGQRGYIITGNQEYLNQAKQQWPSITDRLSRLAPLVEGDASLNAQFAQLRGDLTDRIEVSRVAIAKRQSGGFQPAALLVASGQGKRLTDGIRDIIDDMEATQRHIITAANARTAESLDFVISLSTFGAIAVASAILIAGYLMTRQMTRRVQQLVEVTDVLGGGDLAARVALRGHDDFTSIGRAINNMAANLQASRETLNAFAYTVAHDLRAPLRALQGFSKALIDDYSDQLNTEGRDWARRIFSAAQRMDELLTDILEYSRVNRENMQLVPVKLENVVDDVLASLSSSIAEAKATVTVERPFPAVIAHRPVLEQAITNLITNAVKFTKPRAVPEIRVWAQATNGTVRLWVVDEGIGIAPDHQERIFNVFERLHDAESYPGTGIGLAIVRKGIERMGGRTGVESVPGQGSQFWIELPSGDHS